MYPCIEWAGTPGFEIGNLNKNNLKNILKSKKRLNKLNDINKNILFSRCAPICAHHEMNLFLNNLYENLSKKKNLKFFEKIINNSQKPKHLNFI